MKGRNIIEAESKKKYGNSWDESRIVIVSGEKYLEIIIYSVTFLTIDSDLNICVPPKLLC